MNICEAPFIWNKKIYNAQKGNNASWLHLMNNSLYSIEELSCLYDSKKIWTGNVVGTFDTI